LGALSFINLVGRFPQCFKPPVLKADTTILPYGMRLVMGAFVDFSGVKVPELQSFRCFSDE